jgi:hypothetical protein
MYHFSEKCRPNILTEIEKGFSILCAPEAGENQRIEA